MTFPFETCPSPGGSAGTHCHSRSVRAHGRVARGGGPGRRPVGCAVSLVGLAVLVAALWGSPSWAQDPPAEPESAVVGGSVVTLTYGTALDERSVPAAGAFSVTVAGWTRDVESVEVDGDTVRLGLASVVQAGSTVALDYTAPAVNPLRESGGGPSVADLDGRSVEYTTHIHRQLAVAEQYRLGGVWSDGETMWVGKIQPHGSNHYLRAFDVSTGLRDRAKEVRITTGVDARTDITGLWSDGDYMWVLIADFGERAARIYAYRLNPGASDHGRRSPSRDIELQYASPYSNWSPGGIWSDGETMWVANATSDESIDYAAQVWAYRMNPGGADHGRVLRDKEMLLLDGLPAAGNTDPQGLWSDGETLWVMDGGNCGGVLLAGRFCHAYAYMLNPGAENHGRRVPSREFTLDMRRHPDTITGEEGKGFERKWPQLIAGTWSDGSTIWVQGRGKLAGGHFPTPEYGDKQVIGVPLPLYVRSARVDGAELVLAYNDMLDASSVPPAGAFSVTVNGSARTVSSVQVDGERVLLTLASAVGLGDAVELSYTSPGTNPLKSTGGYTRQRTFSADPDWVTNPADDLDGERVANLTSAVIAASSGLSSTSVGGLWADGEVLWVVEDESNKLLSYRLDTASAGTTVTLAAANSDPAGVWSGGDRVWVADHADDKIYAYDAAGTAVPAEDISTLATAGNNDPRGIWSDGTVMWVADRGDRRVYAYLVGDGARVEGREVALDPDNADAHGAWSDGATLWVADRADAKLYAYSLVGSAHADGARREIVAGVRVPGWDVALPDGVAATGLWANADAVWVADDQTDTVQAYPIRGVSVAPRFTLGRDPRDSRYPKRSGPLDAVAFEVALDTAVDDDVGRPVAAVSAVGSPITYSVGGDDRSDFDIDGSTGQLSAAKVLDFTDGPSYSLVVVATDGEGRTDRAKVVVTTPSPVLDSLTVDDDEVEIEYSRPLDEGSVPGTGAYTVDVSGSTVEVTGVDVGGDTVTVTIGARLWSFDEVRVTYAAPAAGAVRAAGEDGEQARSFTSPAGPQSHEQPDRQLAGPREHVVRRNHPVGGHPDRLHPPEQRRPSVGNRPPGAVPRRKQGHQPAGRLQSRRGGVVGRRHGVGGEPGITLAARLHPGGRPGPGQGHQAALGERLASGHLVRRQRHVGRRPSRQPDGQQDLRLRPGRRRLAVAAGHRSRLQQAPHRPLVRWCDAVGRRLGRQEGVRLQAGNRAPGLGQGFHHIGAALGPVVRRDRHVDIPQHQPRPLSGAPPDGGCGDGSDVCVQPDGEVPRREPLRCGGCAIAGAGGGRRP